MKEGEKIYVESLLSDEELKERKIKYPHTHNSGFTPKFFTSEMMWRYRMGMSKTPEEIVLINKRIDDVLKAIK